MMAMFVLETSKKSEDRETENNAKTMPKTLLFCLLFFVSIGATAQTAEWKAIHRGNRAFRAERYEKADKRYAEALKHNSQSAAAMLNQGLSALKRNDFDGAVGRFDAAAKASTDKKLAASAHYNSGVARQTQALQAQDSGQKQQALRAAIEAYKQSLRLNPSDEAARYNLALCQKQLEDEQQKQDNQNKDNQDQQQNEDNKQDQEKQDKDKQNQQQDQNKNEEKQEQQQPEQQPQKQQQDRQTEQLLNLSRQAEQKTKDKLNRAQRSGRPRSKNW